MVKNYFNTKDLDLLASGLFVDATITCGERTWKVHKIIVSRCDWFKKAFAGNFKEAQTNNVIISSEDFSPDLVDCVVSFIYSGVVNIEKLDTNDSLVDACVRLWAMADFLVFKELRDEAVNILRKYCAEKMKAISVFGDEDEHMVTPEDEYAVLLAQLFRGVETAYTRYPHSVPCQQILIDFFHAVRIFAFGTSSFSHLISAAPHQFSHELLLATINGRCSKWVLNNESEYKSIEPQGKCTGCDQLIKKYRGPWAVDTVMREETLEDWTLGVPWRCVPCFEKHGLDRVVPEKKEVEANQNGDGEP